MRVLRGFSCAGDIGWVLPAENKRKTKQGQHPCLSIGMKVSIRILNSFLLCRTGATREPRINGPAAVRQYFMK